MSVIGMMEHNRPVAFLDHKSQSQNRKRRSVGLAMEKEKVRDKKLQIECLILGLKLRAVQCKLKAESPSV